MFDMKGERGNPSGRGYFSLEGELKAVWLKLSIVGCISRGPGL